MLTKNYKTIIKANTRNVDYSGLVAVQGTSFTYDVSEATPETSGFYCAGTGNCREITETSSYEGVYFGSSDTPATEDDYNLAAPFTSGLSVSSTGVAAPEVSDEKITLRASYVVTNNNTEAITIREIGCFNRVPYSSSKSYLTLFERTVLDNPITIPPGEATSITYRVFYTFAWA